MSNPELTSFKGLDSLQRLGGGLLVVNNSRLASLDGLGALGALNATGAASIGLGALKLTAPSVLVTGNPVSLFSIRASILQAKQLTVLSKTDLPSLLQINEQHE